MLLVVEMGGDLEPRVAHGPEGERVVVEVDQVGVVAVDEVHDPVVELVAVGLVGLAGPVAPVPHVVIMVAASLLRLGSWFCA
jgi:hypothetical protein